MADHYEVYDPATGEITKVYPRAATLPINKIPPSRSEQERLWALVEQTSRGS